MNSGENDKAGGVRQRIEHCFRRIEIERMAGIPILNPALRVEVVGLRQFADEWLCILVTPWFMNVMLLPTESDDGAAAEAASPGAIGSKVFVAFPAGRFELIRGFEAGIGHYRMCSLFSPMYEFADHESAALAAEAALAALIDADTEDIQDPGMAMIWRGERPPREQNESRPNADTTSPRPNTPDQANVGARPTTLSRRGLLLGRARVEDRK